MIFKVKGSVVCNVCEKNEFELDKYFVIFYDAWKRREEMSPAPKLNTYKLNKYHLPKNWIHVNNHSFIVCDQCAPDYMYEQIERAKFKHYEFDSSEVIIKRIIDSFVLKDDSYFCIGGDFYYCSQEQFDDVIRRIETDPIVKEII